MGGACDAAVIVAGCCVLEQIQSITKKDTRSTKFSLLCNVNGNNGLPFDILTRPTHQSTRLRMTC